MGEEQTKILELVAKGEISVEEATQLLDALGDRAGERAPAFEHPEEPSGAEILTAISKAIGADTLSRLHVKNIRPRVRVRRGRTIDQIMSFASLGVSADYAREMKAVLEDVSGDDLVSLSSMGVKPDYVEEIKEAFGGDVSVHDIVGLSSMGVKPDYVEGVREAFGEDVDLGDIMSLSSMGVKPDYVEEIRDALGEDVTVHDIIGLSSLGISAKYIEDLAEAGVEGISVADVIRATHEDK